jgi:hypothetical protein
MKNVDILYDHLVYFTALCYNLVTFGILYGYLVYCSRFGMLPQANSGNPGYIYLGCLIHWNTRKKKNEGNSRMSRFPPIRFFRIVHN